MCTTIEMPKYQSIKKVWALKIKEIGLYDGKGGAVITPAEERYGEFEVSQEYLDKHHPQAGGYYVVYKGGYTSYSPAKAFEEGNVLIDQNLKISIKEFAGKERIVARFGTGEIKFTNSEAEDGEVLLAFKAMDKKHSLDEYIPTNGKSWEEIDPDIVFSFTNPKSIQNIIDSLAECKEWLEEDLKGEKL